MKQKLNHNRSSTATRVVVMRVEEDPPTHAGAIVRKLRQWIGLTQEEFAQRYKVSQAVIAKMEARKDVRLSTLRKLAATLDLKVTLNFSVPDDNNATKLILEVPLNPLPRTGEGNDLK